MILAPALLVLGLTTPQAKLDVSWVKLEDGVKGSWSAKAAYPVVNKDTTLARFFNAEVKQACESRFYEAAYNLRKAPRGTAREFSVRGILSVADDRLVSGLLTVTKTGSPTELYPVTVWLNGKQPLRCVWGSLVRADSNADIFASTLVLPVLNELRKSAGLAVVAEFPSGLLDTFVITQKNVCWIAPTGLAGQDAVQIKVPIADLESWLNTNGPLTPAATAPETTGSMPMRAVVTWTAREPVPSGCILQVSLLRERDDPDPVAVKKFPLKDPPMDVTTSFPGVKVDPDERLYLDVRILNGTEVLFRNRTTIRIPAEGWQTVHAIALDKER